MPRHAARGWRPIVAALGVAALGASLGAAWPAPVHAATLHAAIADLAFVEVPASARVGDVIEWSNRDIVAHTATARDGSFDVVILPGKTGRTVLRKPGRVALYCRYHPSMTGAIDIRP